MVHGVGLKRIIGLDKKIRNQSKDIENFLMNISYYISEIKFIHPKMAEEAPIRLILTHLEREKEYFDNFAHKIRTLIRDNPEYIEWNYNGINLYDALSQICKFISSKPTEIHEEEFINLKNKIDKVRDHYERIEFDIEKIKFDKELNDKLAEVDEIVKNVQSAKEALDGKPTEEIYRKAAKRHINTARFYDVLLICTLVIFYYFTNHFFENFQLSPIFQAIKKSSSETQILAIFFFITKLTIVSIVITLATIFIRRSSHFRKLHDQANQTSLELNALPLYLRQVDSELHSEIYKEMIPKFFGKELDQSQNDKVGDLVKDQLAAGTELIKASAEMVKNAKSLGDSSEKNKNVKTGVNSTESSENKDKPKTE